MTRAIDWGLPAVALTLPLVAWLALPRLFPPQSLELPLLTSATRPSYSPGRFERQVLQEANVPPDPQPFITQVQIAELSGPGQADLVVVDAKRQRVVAYSLPLAAETQPRALAEDLPAPVATVPVDLDRDGDLDLVVALLGELTPGDTLSGGVCWIENDGGTWQIRGLLSAIRAVADVQAGDLDGDGDPDLAVAVLGDGHGQVVWVENLGPEGFEADVLAETAGTAKVALSDLDADGDLDVVALGTREEVEVLAFENLGAGRFERHRPWSSLDPALCLNSLHAHDLDRDGRPELLVTAGSPPLGVPRATRPGEGCFLLSMGTDWTARLKRIAAVSGASDSAVADWDADGDLDVVVVSGDGTPGTATVVLLENSGQGSYLQQTIDLEPRQRGNVWLGDVTGDGRPEILSGGVYRTGPFTSPVGLVIWHDRGEE